MNLREFLSRSSYPDRALSSQGVGQIYHTCPDFRSVLSASSISELTNEADRTISRERNVQSAGHRGIGSIPEGEKVRGDKVLVLGDDTRSFLTTVRSLGRRGVVVHA